MAIIQQIRLRPYIHHNELKRIVVPRHMATRTFDRTIANLLQYKTISFKKEGNRKLYRVISGFPDDSFDTNLDEVLKILRSMKSILEELRDRYPKFSKDKKTQLVHDLADIYFKNRLHIFNFLELLGRLPEHDTL